MDALRLFLAIDIPNYVKEKVSEIQGIFKALKLDVRWVKPSNIHLTLKFLGDTRPDMIPQIKERILPIARGMTPFPVSLGKVGVFPNLRNPKVLWMSVENHEGQLDSLSRKVEAEMSQLGFSQERKKRVHHLTFGRIKSDKGKNRLKKTVESGVDADMNSFEIASVKLLQSELTPQGSIYTELEEFIF